MWRKRAGRHESARTFWRRLQVSFDDGRPTHTCAWCPTLDRYGQVVGNDPICLQKHHQETSRSVGIDKTLGVERSAISMPSRDWGRNRTTPRGTTTAHSCVHISPPLTLFRRRTSPPAGTTCRRDSLHRCLLWKARFPLPDPDHHEGVKTVSLLAHRFLSSLALRQNFTHTHTHAQ